MKYEETKEEFNIVRMSGKGQLVVPLAVRETSNLRPGECFVAYPLEEGVFFKRIELPKVQLDFERLSKEIEAKFRKNKIRKTDIKGAVRWARKG